MLIAPIGVAEPSRWIGIATLLTPTLVLLIADAEPAVAGELELGEEGFGVVRVLGSGHGFMRSP
jgi:hypothetical protein